MHRRIVLKIGCSVYLTILAANAPVAGGPGISPDEDKKGADILYHLDIHNRQIVQPVEPRDGAVEKSKFVKVEITKVFNPSRHFVGFEVLYRTEIQKEIRLGGFSLYPSDNPGTFIVPTQGRVRREGAIVLRLVLADNINRDEPLQVTARRMRFVDE